MDKYNLYKIVQNKRMYDLTQTGKYTLLKYNIMKRKNLCMVQKILDERLLTVFKERYPLYSEGEGLTKNQQNKKGDTSTTSFPKTAYWRPLFLNAKIVDKTKNPYLKNPRVPPVAENEK